jgi:cytochrome c553
MDELHMRNLLVLLALTVAVSCFAPFAVEADDHGKRNKHRERNHERDFQDDAVPAPSNDLYLTTCGPCHMAYPPGLLNAASWSALIQGNDDHFGELLALENTDAQELENYLKENAAENTRGELARDISKDLGDRVVLRITDIPEIREEHRKIKGEVLSRQSIGSLSNCIACHTRADSGIFDDDSVSIPR